MVYKSPDMFNLARSDVIRNAKITLTLMENTKMTLTLLGTAGTNAMFIEFKQ